MAYFKDICCLTRRNLKAFNREYVPGEIVTRSGIYICVSCGEEVICKSGSRFPPQNHHQHETSESIEWKLIVATQGRK